MSPLRVEAAAMLSRIKDPAAGLSLVGLLRDPEETVRQAAFAALEQMAGNLDDETAAGLVRNLHESPDEDVRSRVRQLLGCDSQRDHSLVRNVDPSGGRSADDGGDDPRALARSAFGGRIDRCDVVSRRFATSPCGR